MQVEREEGDPSIPDMSLFVSCLPTIAPCILFTHPENMENYNRFGDVMMPTALNHDFFFSFLWNEASSCCGTDGVPLQRAERQDATGYHYFTAVRQDRGLRSIESDQQLHSISQSLEKDVTHLPWSVFICQSSMGVGGKYNNQWGTKPLCWSEDKTRAPFDKIHQMSVV